MTTRPGRTLAATAMATAALLGAGVAALAAGGSERSTGPDYAYGSANPFAAASAAVHVVHTGEGGTTVTLQVHGADAPEGQRFGAHVHQRPCGPSGADAGGHYQQAGAPGALEAVEVWLDFTVNESGNGHASATRPWALDEATPRSVVIHALPTVPETGVAGARLACIDLDGD